LDIFDPEVLELEFDGVDLLVEVFVVFLDVEKLFLTLKFLFFVLLLFQGLLLEFLFEFIDFVEL
jgi:hypothetical protein